MKVEPEPTEPQQLITSDLEGTQLEEVTPGDLMSSMVVKSANLMGAEKHNLLITFQKPETGEMVITMLPPPPTSTSSSATALQHHHHEQQQQHQHDLHDHTTTGLCFVFNYVWR